MELQVSRQAIAQVAPHGTILAALHVGLSELGCRTKKVVTTLKPNLQTPKWQRSLGQALLAWPASLAALPFRVKGSALNPRLEEKTDMQASPTVIGGAGKHRKGLPGCQRFVPSRHRAKMATQKKRRGKVPKRRSNHNSA